MWDYSRIKTLQLDSKPLNVQGWNESFNLIPCHFLFVIVVFSSFKRYEHTFSFPLSYQTLFFELWKVACGREWVKLGLTRDSYNRDTSADMRPLLKSTKKKEKCLKVHKFSKTPVKTSLTIASSLQFSFFFHF